MLGAYKKLLSANVISSVFSLLTILILLKSFGEADFGIFVFAQSIGVFFAAIANSQSWQAIVLFYSRIDVCKIKCFRFSGLIDVVFAIIVMLWALCFIKYWIDFFGIGGDELGIFYIFSLLTIAAQTGSALGVTRYYGLYGTLSSVKVTVALLRLLLATMCLFQKINIIWIAVFWVGSELFGTMVIWLVAFRELKKEKNTTGSLSAFKIDFMKSVMKGWGIALIDLPVQHADKLFVGAALSPSVLAGYSIIRRITSNVAILVDPYYQILLPYYSVAISEGRFVDIKKMSYQTSVKSLKLMSIVSGAVFLLSYNLDDLLFSGVIKRNVIVFLLFLIGGLVVAWYAYVHPLCYAARLFRLIFISTLVSNSILLFCLWYFSAADNLMGIAVAVAFQPLLIGVWKSMFVPKGE